MLAKQRYTKILQLLDKDGIVHTAELVKLMGVSSETIRKDLEYLDSQGRLSRVHGGACLLYTSPSSANRFLERFLVVMIFALVSSKYALSFTAWVPAIWDGRFIV